MKRRELRILGLSYSQTQVGSYVLVLTETKGKRKLPIIIKPIDAQYIAMKIEGLSTPRPQTQDLFKKMTDALGADLHEVYIHNVIEGIFYAKLIMSNMIDEFEIECSIGDAISLSISYKAPIFTNDDVLKASGIVMEDDGTITEEQLEESRKESKAISVVTVDSLEKMLKKALDNEEYEVASQIRDRIEELKQI